MATAMVMQMRRNVGFMFRESGQAMERLGMSMMGDYSYMEPLSRHRKVMGVHDTHPIVGGDVFVAPNASVIGDVTLGSGSSVWYGAILRGDSNSISVGEGTAVQDKVLVHVGPSGPASEKLPAVIGSKVTVGQGAVLHSCTVHDEAIIGIGAHVLDGATVEKHGMLGAGSILAPGATIKAGEFWSGMPAKMVQKVDKATIDYYLEKVEENTKLAAVHMAEHEKPLDVLEAEKEARRAQSELSDEYAAQMGIRSQLDQAGQSRSSRSVAV